jgi:hypothetical protein
MIKQALPKFLAAACLLTIFASMNASAAIKCWTNNEGVRECGNRVPPEYSQQGHQEISKSGMVVDEQSRVKTREELAEDAQQRELLAEEQLVIAEKKRADNILLATYTNVIEIERARDERLKAIDASITLANKQSETIHLDLDKRIQAAAAAERSGKAPNDALLADIEELQRQVTNKKEYISAREKEKEVTDAEYAANIQRFKELKGLL